MVDRQLYVDATYDDTSMDVTLVYFRDRAPLPVELQGKRFSLDISGIEDGDWASVREALIAIIEAL